MQAKFSYCDKSSLMNLYLNRETPEQQQIANH